MAGIEELPSCPRVDKTLTIHYLYGCKHGKVDQKCVWGGYTKTVVFVVKCLQVVENVFLMGSPPPYIMPYVVVLSTKMLNITMWYVKFIIKSAQFVSFEDHDARFGFRWVMT